MFAGVEGILWDRVPGSSGGHNVSHHALEAAGPNLGLVDVHSAQSNAAEQHSLWIMHATSSSNIRFSG